MSQERDKMIQELLPKIQEIKDQIAKANEKPSWKTNCSFAYRRDATVHDKINIQVISDVEVALEILAFLIVKKESHDKACIELGQQTEFKWFGFTLSEWQSDLKTRIDKMQLINKTEKLKKMEARFEALMSPDLKNQIEFDNLMKDFESLK